MSEETTWAPRQTWQKRLRPISDAMAEVHALANEQAKAATDKELAALAQACRKPTQTNCWWATYHAAPIMAEAVKREQWTRRKARAASRRAQRAASSPSL